MKLVADRKATVTDLIEIVTGTRVSLCPALRKRRISGGYEIFVMDDDGTNVFKTNQTGSRPDWR